MIFVLPGAFAVTFPLLFTVATFVLPDFQTTFLLDASDGEIVAFNAIFFPLLSITEVLFRVIPLTFFIFSVVWLPLLSLLSFPGTITIQVAFTFPTVTTIAAFPTPCTFTYPLSETVATSSFELVHTTASVKFCGVIDAVN